MPQGHAVGQSPGQKSIPLKRLALDFHSSPTADDRGTSILDWSGFGKLLKLLDAVGLERLGIASLDNIPSTLPLAEVRNLRTLQLSGQCSFKDSVFLEFRFFSGQRFCN